MVKFEWDANNPFKCGEISKFFPCCETCGYLSVFIIYADSWMGRSSDYFIIMTSTIKSLHQQIKLHL